jgi:hypothetical protein
MLFSLAGSNTLSKVGGLPRNEQQVQHPSPAKAHLSASAYNRPND